MDNSQLEQTCVSIRKNILKMLSKAGSGHTGGSLSCVEILVTLFFCKLKHDPNNPDMEDRDRFVLSKGHGCPTLYSVMAKRGFFPEDELMTLRKFSTRLQGHPHKNRLPGLECSSGSLGQGLSVANGMALGLRLDKSQARVYCLLGDGELNEGQVWEAAMTAAHYKLDNICAIVDRNHLQIDGPTEEIMNLEPLADKWRAFGWEVICVDGHSFDELLAAYDKAETIKGKPVCVIAETVKGKGVSFVEHQVDWHGVAPTKEELDKAVGEL